MKKLFPLLLLFSSIISAQTVIFTDDFESYNTTQTIPIQTYNWQTWSSGTTGSEASFVSTEKTYSGIKSMKVVENNDMVYDFGGFSTAQWQVSFWIYVAADKSGYFNVEHAFGAEWAFECYFENGVLTLKNGETSTFPYPTDTWIHILIDVNIDTDDAILSLDGVELAIWPYSNLAGGGTYSNPRLDVIDFYSAAGYEFFVDDFTLFNTVPGTIPPSIEIDTTPIITYEIAPIEIPFSIIEFATEDLSFNAYAKFADPSISSTLVAGTMNFDEDNNSAVGWQNSCDVYAAVRFQNDQTSMHIGQEIVSVDVFINDLPIGDITVYIWSKGGLMNPQATAILSEETVTPQAESWNTVTLTNPVQVTGDEIWVGYKFTTPAGGNTLGIDGNTIVPAKNYIKTGVIWSEFHGMEIFGIGNFNIRANVTGAGWPIWLSVTPSSGNLPVFEEQILNLEFNAEELTTGTYNAAVVVGCNDPSSEWNEVPIILDFVSGIDNVTKIGVMTYPNPATQNINVVSDANISSISVYSVTGQFINSFQVNATTTTIDVARMPSGMYIIELNTVNGVVKSKFVVK